MTRRPPGGCARSPRRRDDDLPAQDRLALFREQMKVKRAFEREEALELSYLPESSSTRRSKEASGRTRAVVDNQSVQSMTPCCLQWIYVCCVLQRRSSR